MANSHVFLVTVLTWAVPTVLAIVFDEVAAQAFSVILRVCDFIRFSSEIGKNRRAKLDRIFRKSKRSQTLSVVCRAKDLRSAISATKRGRAITSVNQGNH